MEKWETIFQRFKNYISVCLNSGISYEGHLSKCTSHSCSQA